MMASYEQANRFMHCCKGSTRIVDCDFPETKGRRFLTTHYKRKIPNSKTVDRRWLVYSMHLDSIHFAFAVKYFQFNKHDGYCDWKSITALFLLNKKDLQTTLKHTKYRKSAEPKQTIDTEFQRCILAKEIYWRGVLERL